MFASLAHNHAGHCLYMVYSLGNVVVSRKRFFFLPGFLFNCFSVATILSLVCIRLFSIQSYELVRLGGMLQILPNHFVSRVMGLIL